jgi:hypothetical protein
MNGIVVAADDKTGRATHVTRISYSEQELLALAKTVEHLPAHHR